MAKVLSEVSKGFPFDWVNLSSYRESSAFRKEIYLRDHESAIEGLIALFYSLFGKKKNDLFIFNNSWWDFCLDTWIIDSDQHNYDLKGKSPETQAYLRILIESEIHPNYSGCCSCDDWDRFLFVALECIINHKAPYSPIFFNIENEYFFYFHFSGSIGIYYKEQTEEVKNILLRAKENYILED